MIYAILTLVLVLQPGKTRDAEFHRAIYILDQMKRANELVVDMQCVFTMDVVKEKTHLPLQRTIFRYRTHPETILLTFIEPHKGRTVVYTPEGGMRVRPDGILHFMTFSVDPLSDRAMEEAIDPITAQGFPRIVAVIDSILHTPKTARKYTVSIDSVYASPGQKKTYSISLSKSPSDSLTLEVDAATFFPSKVVKIAGTSSAVYRYEDIEINKGLLENDFAP
jgi:hypothetical protein